MRMKVALIALTLVGAASAVSLPAHAATVAFDLGNVAFGYSDGYWDRAHHWHAWRNHGDRDAWRAHDGEHYYAHRHTSEKDHGWHNEHYWEH